MTENFNIPAITPETCFVPQIYTNKGRRISVKPGETAARHLHYGRIIIENGDAMQKAVLVWKPRTGNDFCHLPFVFMANDKGQICDFR